MSAAPREVWVMEPLGWPEDRCVHGVYSSSEAAIAAAKAWIEGSIVGYEVTTIDRTDDAVTINDDHGGGYRAARFVVDDADDLTPAGEDR